MPDDSRFEVVIVGGGIMGSSTAYWLASNPNFQGSVAVVEKDPTYTYSTTARSNSSIRMQFSTGLNIELSKFGIHFIKNAASYLATNDEPPHLSFVESGYLFLATTEAERRVLWANYAVQRAHGIEDVITLEPDDLARRFPWLNVGGVTGATLGLRNEGWFDPYGLLQAFKRKARSLGVTYLADEVVGLRLDGRRITQVQLKDRRAIDCAVVVNAAGAWSRNIAAMVGIDIPVYPRRRFVFVFRAEKQIENCPLVIDPLGFYFRPEGEFYLCGMKPPADLDPNSHDFEVDYSWFEERLWPLLWRWVPDFAAVKVQRAWTGHYEYNTFDRNALLGLHPAIENLYFCNGFSGHGMQQSPAAGRGISELITYGAYRSLDLSPFSIERLVHNRPIVEQYVV